MMKRTIKLTFLLFTLLTTSISAQIKVSGRLVDEQSNPIEFANVTLQSTDFFRGNISDDQGRFEIQVLAGHYMLKISMIGYTPYENELSVDANLDLGDILIKESAIGLGEVVVKANRVVRAADRFIVILTDDPTVIGKTGSDVLSLSPGVFVQDKDGSISINGKSGTKVYINERPLHESGADLLRYLQNLKAEDIVRIEVLPTAGADYDADSASGIIKITLKHQRNDGINGGAGMSYSFAPDEDVYSFQPSYSMNYKNNRLSLYTTLNYQDEKSLERATEEIKMLSQDRHLESNAIMKTPNRNGNMRLGGIYDLDEKQSLGIEGYYSHNKNKRKTSSHMRETISTTDITDIASLYKSNNTKDYYSVSTNYISKLDAEGSIFKVLLDYYHNKSDDKQDYNSQFQGYLNYDSIYRSKILTENNLYAANTDLSIKINDYSRVSTGLKYTHSNMENTNFFEYKKGTIWHENKPFSNINEYKEDIAAVYGSFSSQIKIITYSVGLRGEYTKAKPWTNKTTETKKQSYFELFPSANIMLPLVKDGKHSLVLNYNRKIYRPTFSDLNPFRVPASEYTYIQGNPDLKAAISNDYSLGLRFFNQYNLTAGITDTRRAFDRVTLIDPNMPDIIILRMDNIAKNKMYYLSLNTPLQPAKWWQINVNLMGFINHRTVFNERLRIKSFRGYIGNMFYLPKDLYIDLNGFYMSPFYQGNMKTRTEPQINISFRKLLLEKRLSLNVYLNNIFDTGTVKLRTKEEDLDRYVFSRYSFREFGVSVRYSFQIGKNIQVKNVESGSAEEKERLK